MLQEEIKKCLEVVPKKCKSHVFCMIFDTFKQIPGAIIEEEEPETGRKFITDDSGQHDGKISPPPEYVSENQ